MESPKSPGIYILGIYWVYPLLKGCNRVVKQLGALHPKGTSIFPMILRLFQHTELKHTPSNLYQQAISRDSFRSGRTGGLPVSVCDIRGGL